MAADISPQPNIALSPPSKPPLWRRAHRAAEHIWRKHWFGWLLLAVFSVWALYWGWKTPSSGKAGLLLALAATLMSARNDLKGIARGLWILLLFALLIIENRALDNDKKESQQQLTNSFAALSKQADHNFKETLQQSNENLKSMLKDEHTNFANVLSSQEEGFLATLKQMFDNDRNENTRFSGMLNQQQKLFQQQTEFSAFLNGKLLPAADPMPPNRCRHAIGSNEMAVFVGDNVGITDRFPHTVVGFGSHSAVGINRSNYSGELSLVVDMRDANGKIILRLNENGFRSSNGIAMLRPDKSTVLFEDEEGNEFFRARYINPNAFTLKGSIVYKGQLRPVQNPNIHDVCSVDSGGNDFRTD